MRSVVRTATVLALVLPAVLGTGAVLSAGATRRADPAGCSVASLRGTYGLTGEGNFGGVPFDLLATLAFDGSGKVTGRGTAVLDAPAAVVPFTVEDGTYAVASDCMGTGRFFVHHDGLSPIDHFHAYDLVVSDAGRQIGLVMTTTELQDGAPSLPAESVSYLGRRM